MEDCLRGGEPEEQEFLDKSPTITARPIVFPDRDRDFLEGGQVLEQGKRNTDGGGEGGGEIIEDPDSAVGLLNI